MQAAEAAHAALEAGRAGDELASYEEGWRESEIGRDLAKVRNVKPLWTKFGLWLGVPPKIRPQRLSVRTLACCRFRGHRDWVFHEGGGGRCNDENLPESSRSRQFG